MAENKQLTVLLVDDEINLRESLAELVESEGFRSSQASNGEDAIKILREAAVRPDMILLDMRMPRLDGLGVLRTVKDEKLTDAPIIVVSAFGDSSKMIEAMKLGAYDYITKPLDVDEIVAILHRAAEQRRLGLEAETARQLNRDGENNKQVRSDTQQFEMLGTSRVMRDIFKQIGRVAATDATVLITGESGTGKAIVARCLKTWSRLNCSVTNAEHLPALSDKRKDDLNLRKPVRYFWMRQANFRRAHRLSSCVRYRSDDSNV